MRGWAAEKELWARSAPTEDSPFYTSEKGLRCKRLALLALSRKDGPGGALTKWSTVLGWTEVWLPTLDDFELLWHDSSIIRTHQAIDMAWDHHNFERSSTLGGTRSTVGTSVRSLPCSSASVRTLGANACDGGNRKQPATV